MVGRARRPGYGEKEGRDFRKQQCPSPNNFEYMFTVLPQPPIAQRDFRSSIFLLESWIPRPSRRGGLRTVTVNRKP